MTDPEHDFEDATMTGHVRDDRIDGVNIEMYRTALERTRGTGTEHLPEALPWTRFLSQEDRITFLEEAVATMRASTATGQYAAFEQLIREWENTAEIHAYPQLVQALSQPVDWLEEAEPVARPRRADRRSG